MEDTKYTKGSITVAGESPEHTLIKDTHGNNEYLIETHQELNMGDRLQLESTNNCEGINPAAVPELLEFSKIVNEEWHLAHDQLKELVRSEKWDHEAYSNLLDILNRWQDEARAALAKAKEGQV